MEIRALQTFTPPELAQLYRNDSSTEEKALSVKSSGDVVVISDKGSETAILSKAVDTVSKFLESQNQSLGFYIHDVSGQMVVRITNGKTHEVIKQIPSEEVISLSASLRKLAEQLVGTESESNNGSKTEV